jgi:hypothetical protein
MRKVFCWITDVLNVFFILFILQNLFAWFSGVVYDLWMYQYCWLYFTNSRSAAEGIPNILQNAKIHYRVYKILPQVPILSQMNLVHISILHLYDSF